MLKRTCSVIGGVFIILGLYIVLWGKAKEMKRAARLVVPDVSNNDSKRIDVVITSSDHTSNDTAVEGRVSSSPSRIQTIQISDGPIRQQS